jgi:hypothetical protein
MTPVGDENEPALGRRATDPGADPVAAEARGAALLDEVHGPLLDGLAAALPRWLAERAGRVLTVWRPGALDATALDALDAAAHAATQRVVLEVRALLDLDPVAQRATPLTIVRSAHREPGAVLAGLGVAHVARDPFEVRSAPDDVYALAPPDLAAVDPDLGPLLLAWGVGKATVLRARAARDRGAQPPDPEVPR